MNPILSAALGSIIRAALAGLAGYLVKAGIWTASDSATYVTAATLFLLAGGWSLYEKYRSRSKVLTALMMPALSTEDELKERIKTGVTPSILTPSNTIPGIPLPPPPKP